MRTIAAAAAKLAVVIALVAFARWLADPSLLYRWETKTLVDVYHATHRHVGPIDLAVMGSSRAQFAFDGERFAETYARLHGREVVVLDASKPFRAPEVEYLMLRRLFAARPVRHVLVEYQQGLGQDHHHPNLHLAAGFGEIAEVCWAQRHRPAWQRAQRIVDLWLRRPAGLVTLALTGGLYEVRVDPEALRPAETRDPSSPRHWVRSEAIAARRDAHPGWRSAPPRVWEFGAERSWPDEHYAQRIVELARAHGATASFFAPGWVYDPPLADSVVAEFEERFGAPLIQLPRELLERMSPAGYADTRHASPLGARLWSDYLAARMDLR